MLSVLSVPLMINTNSPTMVTVDLAYRISTHGDYPVFFLSSRRRHTMSTRDWSSDVCSSDLALLRRVLGDEGFKVRSARDGEAGLASALDNQPDLLILDVGLPKRNGLEVIQELRRKGVSAPTLMLTARAQVAERVSGLEAGADDYLLKPFV